MIIPSHMGPARWSKAEGKYQVDHPGIMGAAGLITTLSVPLYRLQFSEEKKASPKSPLPAELASENYGTLLAHSLDRPYIAVLLLLCCSLYFFGHHYGSKGLLYWHRIFTQLCLQCHVENPNHYSSITHVQAQSHAS